MNAKDKEKLKLAGTIVSFAKGDPIVIDPEEYKNEFGNKKKEVETEQTETDAEKLSVGINIILIRFYRSHHFRV